MVIFGIFAFFIILAVFIFAGLGGSGGSQGVGTVTVWGTFDQDMMDDYLSQLNDTDTMAGHIKYVQIPEDSFNSELIDALASGTGPDLFFLDQSNILKYWNKIYPIPYDGISKRGYMDTFVDEAELFLSKRGILGMPFAIDPMVLYWNRDIFAESGIGKPPKYWNELLKMSEQITKTDENSNIEISTIAFGTFDNVNHAKDILATLIMQKGGGIVQRTEDGQLYSAIDPQGKLEGVSPAQVVVRSYTEFANPSKPVYTWNSSLPNSLDMFARGKLAMYIGYASEIKKIKSKNPNLNFDVAVLPQVLGGENRRTLTFGKMYAVAIPKQAKNIYGASVISNFLSGSLASTFFAKINDTFSPRRGILSTQSDDVLKEVFRRSALIARAWLDPNPAKTDKIFRNMINYIISGRMRYSEAVARANRELRALIQE